MKTLYTIFTVNSFHFIYSYGKLQHASKKHRIVLDLPRTSSDWYIVCKAKKMRISFLEIINVIQRGNSRTIILWMQKRSHANTRRAKKKKTKNGIKIISILLYVFVKNILWCMCARRKIVYVWYSVKVGFGGCEWVRSW